MAALPARSAGRRAGPGVRTVRTGRPARPAARRHRQSTSTIAGSSAPACSRWPAPSCSPILGETDGADGSRSVLVARGLGDPGADPTVWLERRRRLHGEGADETIELHSAARAAGADQPDRPAGLRPGRAARGQERPAEQHRCRPVPTGRRACAGTARTAPRCRRWPTRRRSWPATSWPGTSSCWPAGRCGSSCATGSRPTRCRRWPSRRPVPARSAGSGSTAPTRGWAGWPPARWPTWPRWSWPTRRRRPTTSWPPARPGT